MTQQIKDDVIANITQLREVISNLNKSGDKDTVGYYENILRLQEHMLVEILSEQKEPDQQVFYHTDNYGVVTPETAKQLVKVIGTLRG